ncbi:MAG TPA: YncE family protein [Phycisphaerae bacterium]|nr:YncE family protein [Phycisphaerae bacterium]
MGRAGKRFMCAAVVGACLLGSTIAGWGADVPSFAVTNTINVGGVGGWDYVTVSADGQRLYAPRGTNMQVIDLANKKVIATIPGTKRGHGCVLVPSAGRGFITFGGDGSVVVFDLDSNKVLGTLKTEADADGIFFDTATQKVILVSGDGNSVWRIDPGIDLQTGKPEGPLALGGAPESFALDGQGKAFINLADKAQIAVVDLNAWKVLDHWSVSPAKTPVGMAYDPKTKRLFSSCRSGQMMVLNAENGMIIGELPIGPGVDASVFDGKYAFASCADGTLAVVGEKSPGEYAVLQTVKTGVGARTMTLDPRTDTIYLVTADVDPKSPTVGANGKPVRPKFLPNTFKVLVVSQVR